MEGKGAEGAASKTRLFVQAAHGVEQKTGGGTKGDWHSSCDRAGTQCTSPTSALDPDYPSRQGITLSNSLHPFDRQTSCTDSAVVCLLTLQMMETKPLKRKTFFPAIKAKALGQLSWEGLPPTAAILRKQAFAVQMQQPEIVTVSKQTKIATKEVSFASQMTFRILHVMHERCCIACVRFMQAAGKAPPSESSSESLGAVEFLDDDSTHPALKVLGSMKQLHCCMALPCALWPHDERTQVVFCCLPGARLEPLQRRRGRNAEEQAAHICGERQLWQGSFQRPSS